MRKRFTASSTYLAALAFLMLMAWPAWLSNNWVTERPSEPRAIWYTLLFIVAVIGTMLYTIGDYKAANNNKHRWIAAIATTVGGGLIIAAYLVKTIPALM